MKKKIVRRTYTINEGKPSNRVDYLMGNEANGTIAFSVNMNDALLLNENNVHYSNQTISGNDRYGDYSYKQEVLDVKIEIVGENNEQGLSPSFWFMRDNHTFIKLVGKNIDEIKKHAIEVAKENTYGMVCPVIISKGKDEVRRIGESCHVDGKGDVDLTKWWDEIMKEDCVRLYNSI